MDEESANKFISALIKSVQTLCHGYVDFSNGVEIIGHINLNIDKGSSFDYILKEKVCRNDENSTLFISNSFHAQPKGEQAFKPNSVQSETHVSHRRHSTDTSESNKLSSVISSISTALSGSHSQTKSRSGSRDNLTSNTHQSHPVQSTAKRKAEDDISSDLHPVKSASISRHDSSSGHQHFFTSQSPSHPSGSNSPIDSKASFIPCVGDSSQRTSTSLSDDVHSHVTATMLPQTASITSDNQSDIGVNLEGSVLERIDDRSNSETHDKDDSDLDLEVTFIKEEYVEGDRSACEFQNSSGNQALNRASNQRASSDGVQDPPLYPVALHTNASATYVPSSHEIAAMAHYAAAGAIQQNSMGMPGSSQPQPGPSGLGQSGMRGLPGGPSFVDLLLPSGSLLAEGLSMDQSIGGKSTNSDLISSLGEMTGMGQGVYASSLLAPLSYGERKKWVRTRSLNKQQTIYKFSGGLSEHDQGLSPEECKIAAEREKRRVMKRLYRATLSDEKKNKIRERDAERKRLKRAGVYSPNLDANKSFGLALMSISPSSTTATNIPMTRI